MRALTRPIPVPPLIWALSPPPPLLPTPSQARPIPELQRTLPPIDQLPSLTGICSKLNMLSWQVQDVGQAVGTLACLSSLSALAALTTAAEGELATAFGFNAMDPLILLFVSVKLHPAPWLSLCFAKPEYGVKHPSEGRKQEKAGKNGIMQNIRQAKDRWNSWLGFRAQGLVPPLVSPIPHTLKAFRSLTVLLMFLSCTQLLLRLLIVFLMGVHDNPKCYGLTASLDEMHRLDVRLMPSLYYS